MDLRSQVAGPVQRISGVFESKCGHPPDRMQGPANKLKIIVMKVTRGALVLGATMATVKHEQLPFKTCDYHTRECGIFAANASCPLCHPPVSGEAMRNSSLHFSFYDGQDLKKLWSYATHHALVLELLTEAMDHDLSLHYAITEYARNDFQAQAMVTIEERYKGQPETIEFYRAKFVGITQSAFDLSQNRMSQSPSSRDLQASLARRTALEINILEAVKLGLDQKTPRQRQSGDRLGCEHPWF